MFLTSDDTGTGEERDMSEITDTGEPASELERLIADLPGSGLQAFIFGVGWWVAHLAGVTTHLFRGPADRRWWHIDLGDDATSWTMDVRVDEIPSVRFGREPYPFPSFPGRELLTVGFLGQTGRARLAVGCTTCMTGSGCARRSCGPGGHCASVTATAMSPGSIGADSCPRLPEAPRQHQPAVRSTSRDLPQPCHNQGRDSGAGHRRVT